MYFHRNQVLFLFSFFFIDLFYWNFFVQVFLLLKLFRFFSDFDWGAEHFMFWKALHKIYKNP